jgi:hypothetical protein
MIGPGRLQTAPPVETRRPAGDARRRRRAADWAVVLGAAALALGTVGLLAQGGASPDAPRVDSASVDRQALGARRYPVEWVWQRRAVTFDHMYRTGP